MLWISSVDRDRKHEPSEVNRIIPNCGKQSCFTDCFPDQREWQKHGIDGVNEVMERSGITECSR
jgi:hypothetical protein